jgi:DNA-binding XRE family transcriptional regulator
MKMCNLQMTETIERQGKRFVLVPEKTYQRMLDALEDLDDIKAYDAAKAKPLTFVPAAIVDRIIAGESPIKTWREHRGLTQEQLADKAGLSKPYVSQIESKRRVPSLGTMRKIAESLDTDVDSLLP